MSKKITLNADETAATIVEAEFVDIVGTMFSSKTALTGSYKLIQTGLAAAGGAMVQNWRLGRGLNFLNAQ